MYRAVRIQHEDFDLGAETEQLRAQLAGRIGALSVFVGLVREQFEDSAVNGLHLEHYPGMTEQSIGRILDQVEQRWLLDAAVIVHRVGTLHPGDQIVLVIAAAGHRKDSLEACTFMIDYLKTDAVFWKKELLADGARWIESFDTDYARVKAWQRKDA